MQPIDATLQDIRLFIAVYEEKSFTAAARRDNVMRVITTNNVGDAIARRIRCRQTRSWRRFD